MKIDTEELAAEFDLEQWFQRESRPYHLSRGRSGMQINAMECVNPACGDRRYRTYLNADTGAGNCFVCNQTYNKFRFVHLALGHDLDDKKSWADTYKHIKEALSEQGWRPKRMATAAVEMDHVELPASFELPTPDGRNLQYLENRGISADHARYFNLRFCEHGIWRFKKDDGTDGWQKFDGRVIVPVFDLDGQLKTFQGRDIFNVSDKKYLFPSGLPGTGRYLLNGQNFLGTKRACLGEGIFDVIATKIALDQEPELRDVLALGSFGKHLSYGSVDGDDQLGRFLQLKRRGLEEVVIMWDGEWKALIAALEAAKNLRGIGLKVRIAVLPADKDPNEVPPLVVRRAFWEAKPYTDMLAAQWMLRNPILPAKA